MRPSTGYVESPEVAQLLDSAGFRERAGQVAADLARPEAEILEEAAGHLHEMAAVHDRRVGEIWGRLGRWMTRGYDVLADEDGLAELRRLDRRHSLVFLVSHRSYLDEFSFPPALIHGGLEPFFGIAGGNLDFFPLGNIARRNGIVHVRRSTADVPVYRFALRELMTALVANRRNLGWSIEGGRTRTGKLRPPRYGLLRYVADGLDLVPDADPLLVPVSLMYDQIPMHEVTRMASEARGGRKEAEDIRWLIGYAAGLKERRGRIYVDFGTPMRLRERLAQIDGEAGAGSRVERVALDVCHRLNEASPITPTAAVCIALLAEDRALTLDEVLATVRPFAEYVHTSGRPVAGAANLTDRSTLRWALRELARSGVLDEYRGGSETVWGIADDQHLVAAFYRNSVIHVLLVRALAELALLAVAEGRAQGPSAIVAEALRLRELLKFDFFFAGREDFAAEIAAEVAGLRGEPLASPTQVSAEDAELWLAKAHLRVAPLVLRPYVDAYRIVAQQLVEHDAEVITDVEAVVAGALRVGRQWALQRQVASAESVSGEMFRTALKLAAHRDLLSGADAHPAQAHAGEGDLAARRRAFAEEVAAVAQAITRVAATG